VSEQHWKVEQAGFIFSPAGTTLKCRVELTKLTLAQSAFDHTRFHSTAVIYTRNKREILFFTKICRENILVIKGLFVT